MEAHRYSSFGTFFCGQVYSVALHSAGSSRGKFRRENGICQCQAGACAIYLADGVGLADFGGSTDITILSTKSKQSRCLNLLFNYKKYFSLSFNSSFTPLVVVACLNFAFF